MNDAILAVCLVGLMVAGLVVAAIELARWRVHKKPRLAVVKVYDARAIAQDLQTALFAHPQTGAIPVSASVVEAAIYELRRQWTVADSCSNCRGLRERP